MIEVSTTRTINEFHQLLKLVDRGESIRITNHGKARARIIQDFGFMSGAEAAMDFQGGGQTNWTARRRMRLKKTSLP
jgi:hypothetical protein